MNAKQIAVSALLISATVMFGWCPDGFAESEKKNYIWGFTDAIHRVFPDKPYTGPRGNQWQLDAARNEYESCQLVLAPTASDLLMTESFVQDFQGPAGAKIPSSAVTVRLVRTVKVDDRQLPDPLPDAYPIDIRKGTVQSYWITVHVPQDAKVGTYQTTITVSTVGTKNHGILEFPLKLRVRDFDLPTFSRYQMVGLTPELLGQQYHIVHCLATVLRPKGTKIILDEDDNLHLDFEEFDRNVEKELARGVREFSVGLSCTGGGGLYTDSFDFRAHTDGRVFLAIDDPTGTPGPRSVWLCPIDMNDPNTDTPEVRKARKYFTQYLSQIYQHLEAKDWTQYFWIYGADEPHEAKLIKPLTRYFALIKEIAPNLRIMITKGPTEEYGPNVDAVCIMVNHLGAETAQTARKYKQELWVYSCGHLANPSLIVAQPAIDIRVWHWLQEKWQVRRTLLWNTVEGADNFDRPGADGRGDGQIFWQRKGPDGNPVYFTGIRAEMLRDGIEDREYIYKLKQLTDKLAKKKDSDSNAALLAKAKQLAEVPDEIVETQFKMNRDPSVLLKRRAQIADMIEQLQTVLAKSL